MNDKCSIRLKSFALIIIALLLASATMMAMKIQTVQGQTVLPPGVIPTNVQSGASELLPTGVTPDVTYSTISHMSFRPNPIGVGQPLLVNLWLQPPICILRYFDNAFKVTLTKPDGSTDVVVATSFRGDTTGWFNYNVDQVGNWTIKFDFLGGYFPPGNTTYLTSFGLAGPMLNYTLNSPLGVYYAPSHDGPYTLTVQTQQALSWPASPLPADYWTRPVNPLNREWWPILGNYPGTGAVGGGQYWPADTNAYAQSTYHFIPYVQAPNTCHIVWNKQTALSGMIGGNLYQYSNTGYGTTPSIIYDGRAYGTQSKPGSGTTTVTYWQCYDLRTGQLYWERPLAAGESAPNLLAYITRTVSAVTGDIASTRNLGVMLAYVGGGMLVTYDAWSGATVWNISIAPLTTGTFYANGESAPLFYSIQDLGANAGANRYRLINWTVIGDEAYPDLINRRMGIISNTTWPFSTLGTVDYESGIAVSTAGITPSSVGVAYTQIIMAASLRTGQLLWNITTDSSGLQGFFSGSTAIADHGKFAVRENDGHWHCWDLQTGKELWVSEISSWPWGTFGIYGASSAYGLLIYPQYDGVVAYNWTNGKVVWQYAYPSQYPYDNAFSNDYPFYDSIIQIADGKIYTSNTEHTPSQPVERGYSLHCINATTGQGIWNISGSMGAVGVADGYLVAGNRYDGYMYVFGKGQSATTVMAPLTTVPQGTSVLIQGTVMDKSPATTASPHYGAGQAVPCVSDSSMKTWMEYLYMQAPIAGVGGSATITGVPITLLATGSDGTVYNIGTATTNGYFGTFSYTWTPPKVDAYTITAVFAGDDSYGSSAAVTGLSIGSATATPTSTSVPAQSVPDYNMTIIGTGIAVILAVAVATVLILRKRP